MYELYITVLYVNGHSDIVSVLRVWVNDKSGKRLPVSVRRSYTPAFLLRQRMLAFIQNIEYYMMFEVIERHWHQFLQDMNKVNKTLSTT